MNKYSAGIVSVTFRQYECSTIIRYLKSTKLTCIEWGSDIHVPIQDTKNSTEIYNETVNNGYCVASYGSYYRLGVAEDNRFDDYLVTAEILKAPNIRVWGGLTASNFMSKETREKIINDAIGSAQKAKEKNIDISVEYHNNTITDSIDSAIDFIKNVRDNGGDNVYLYWQPDRALSFEDNKNALKQVCPYLSNVHVFAWDKEKRLPLSEYADYWIDYVKIIKDNSDKNHSFLLEFVLNNSVEQFVQDADTLINILLGN